MQTPTQSRYADTATLRETLTALKQFAATASGDFAAAIPRLGADLIGELTANGMDRKQAESHAVDLTDRLVDIMNTLNDLGLATGSLSELVAAGRAKAAQQKAEAVA